MLLRRLTLLAALAPILGFSAPQQPLPRSTPEEQGISSTAILNFLDQAEERVEVLHSVMIVRHGRVVAEGWWSPFSADEPHVLYSLSKSFTSTAVGLAISEGKLSLDDKVLKFFPQEAPAVPGKNLEQMRVRDLLRMSSGQSAGAISNFPFTSTDADLARVFLELPVEDIPGTHFVYNTPGAYMLSAIVQKATGQSVLDYLKLRLFQPLGIENPTWDASAQGVSFGGFGLNLRTEDIAKFGLLYLDHGLWNGRQLIPASWIQEATKIQTANGSDPTSDWNQGYGYQFWRARHNIYRGDGAFGQFCIVIPDHDTVVAITSGTGNMPEVMNVLWETLLPALADAPLAANPDGDRRLSEKLSSLELPTVAGQADSPTGQKVSGRRYDFPKNGQELSSVSVRFGGGGADPVVSYTIGDASGALTCGHGDWVKGTVDYNIPGVPEGGPVAASGAWTSGDTYTFKMWRYLTPYETTYDLRFAGDSLILEMLDNVSLTEAPRRIRLVGTAATHSSP